jgi:hypothetical protein
VDFWVFASRDLYSFSAKELVRQAQCSVKVFIACSVESCLRQTPSRVNIFVFAGRRKRDSLLPVENSKVFWRAAGK